MNQMASIEVDFQTNSWKSPISQGLNRTLIGWFLFLALLPFALVSGFVYLQAKDTLEHSTFASLEASVQQRKRFVDNWFHYRFLDLEAQSTNLKNFRFMEDLKLAFEESGKPVGEFVGSYSWTKIAEDQASDLYSFRRTYGYYDAFLIDLNGNILFTVRAEADLGTNLFHGPYSTTLFAKAAKSSLQSGKSTFSDYEFYAPSANEAAGFLVSPIVDDMGEKIGLFALQLPHHLIDENMRRKVPLGKTVEIYLIGVDGVARSNSVLKHEGMVLKRSIETEQVQKWRERLVNRELDQKRYAEPDPMVYAGPNNSMVLGVMRTIQIGDVIWGLVAEVEEREALIEVNQLRFVFTFLILVTIIVVLIVSISIAHRIVEPLHLLSRITRRVAQGSYDEVIPDDYDNEIGELATSFDNMLEALRIAHVKGEAEDWMNSGALGLADVLRGDRNVTTLSQHAVSFLCNYTGAKMASAYLMEPDGETLKLIAAYAFDKFRSPGDQIRVGEGLAGQVVIEKEMIVLSDVPEDYTRISSALGSALPKKIIAAPLLNDEEVIGVIEFAWSEDLPDTRVTFLRDALEDLAGAIAQALMHDSVLQSEVKTRSIVETATDSIVTVDEYGIIQSANKSTEAIFGYRTDELIGKNVAIFAPDLGETGMSEDIDPFTRIDASMDIGVRGEVNVRRKDGSVFPALLSVGEARIASQTTYHGFFQDISTQKKAEEEITNRNDRLEVQTAALRSSREQLAVQQEELRQTNEELVGQSQRIERQNVELMEAQRGLEERASELELVSQYKSEFLANMSHELRTPLNSLLVLSQLLSANKEGNLSEKQIESIKTIHAGGKDLLKLINDILDLSKVEAGMVEYVVESINLEAIADGVKRQFQPTAQDQGLNMIVEVAPELPALVHTDHQRVTQILRNLMSNAIKFTAEGGTVRFSISRPKPDDANRAGLVADSCIAFGVADTGVGIASDKQGEVFEAFVQADSSTSRKFGGTGLGLSISKQFAEALGGEIVMESVEQEGSIFTLLLPESAPDDLQCKPVSKQTPGVESASSGVVEEDEEPDNLDSVRDDRREIEKGDKSLLVIEDDVKFARILVDLAREKKFKCIIAGDGETGLHYADYYEPSAIILDIQLPGLDGWTVIDRLKDSSTTRHIPVHIMSVMENAGDAMRLGAVGVLNKPVELDQIKEALAGLEHKIEHLVKNLMIVTADEETGEEILELIGASDVESIIVKDGAEASRLLGEAEYDCLVIHPPLSDMETNSFFKLMKENPVSRRVPVVLYSGDGAAPIPLDDDLLIRSVKSPGRLLDETTLFLHRVEAQLPDKQRDLLKLVHDKESILSGKKVLLTDDDMRNVFALSAVLEDKGLKIIVAKNGKEALEKLELNSDIDVVLMDIMMPEMDGYEATRRIRQQDQYAELPIIALTANAMSGDRKKCIDAGASDYLSKPVDLEKLTSLLRVWLYK